MPQPFVSIRKSIRWLPDPPSEPTSTVVLTSAAGSFVDIRLFKSAVASRDTCVLGKNDEDVEWAFAGHAASSPAKDGKPAHTVWTHWIDSKSDAPVSDEGDMYPQQDGDVLERGHMRNPVTGKDCDYEEVWCDLDVHALEGEDFRSCVVYKADSALTGAKGMVIIIGEWCQGILKTDEGLTIAHWQWLDDGHADDDSARVEGNKPKVKKGWTRLAASGQGNLPSPTMLRPSATERPTDHFLGGLEWRVAEHYHW